MEKKFNSDSQAVTWSVAVLCASLLLVYVVQYFVKWDMWKQSLESCDNNWWNTWVVLSQLWNENANNSLNTSWWSYFMESLNTGTNWIWNTWKVTHIVWKSGDTVNMYTGDSDNSSMLILSGTKTYYWTMNFVEKLWINYKYALVDDKWIYYLNMWDYKYDFSDIARKLWWNLYIMNTEQEILQNAMFGDKVTYINVPEYKNNLVLILLDINNQSWLLAIDYSIYHQVKSYLKSLFITTS